MDINIPIQNTVFLHKYVYFSEVFQAEYILFSSRFRIWLVTLHFMANVKHMLFFPRFSLGVFAFLLLFLFQCIIKKIYICLLVAYLPVPYIWYFLMIAITFLDSFSGKAKFTMQYLCRFQVMLNFNWFNSCELHKGIRSFLSTQTVKYDNNIAYIVHESLFLQNLLIII